MSARKCGFCDAPAHERDYCVAAVRVRRIVRDMIEFRYSERPEIPDVVVKALIWAVKTPPLAAETDGNVVLPVSP